MDNPLFPQNNQPSTDQPKDQASQTTPSAPGPDKDSSPTTNAAVNLIRQKLQHIYAEEPNAKAELVEAETIVRPLSKHQQFIEGLKQSGKSLAEIQTEWHRYYINLPDNEKFAVWQEFYTSNSTPYHSRPAAGPHPQPASPPAPGAPTTETPQPKPIVSVESQPTPALTPKEKQRTLAEAKRLIVNTIQGRERLKAKDHLKSLAFGLACGLVVIAIFLFSFFNEVIIAPFIQPSRHVSSIPLIITANTVNASTPEVIIPKINVEIPVNYSETSTDENVIENDLEDGVVHYPNTVMPGQNGNAAFFGHSSNNIFNPGKYKFAFVLLHTLVNGDTFYLTDNNTIYAYEVVSHKIVPPNDVSVLNDTDGHQATATLITCDPPGTSINRLIVTGVQISPNPSGNSAAPTTAQVAAAPTTLPGNGPSLWSRFVHWLF